MSAAGITIVGASAGSGKTYRLTQEVIGAVCSKDESRVPLEGLVAVTFTRKAHAELSTRIRQKLVASGAFDEAMRLPLAYLGTVHSACLRLLQEFALDAGLSPHVDVVGEDQSKLLREALHASLPKELCARLDRLARRLELRHAPMLERFDWLTPVGDIMDLARANRIPPGELSRMAERSFDGLIALLQTPVTDANIDASLRAELSKAVTALVASGDETKKTADTIELLREAMRRLEDDELYWSYWQKLAAVEPSKSCKPLVASLRSTAAKYEAHPRLHEELRALTGAIFEAAAIGLVGYQQWKQRRRVLDYVDMLDRGLSLLDNERVRTQLRSQLRFAVVDEFQDTSPIQLALFVRLHEIAGRSVWVGDRKQCIFEYAGADPLLMDAVAQWAGGGGGRLERLEANYRSRPELVAACSELFSAALGEHGFSRDEVVVSATRSADGIEALPPMGIFRTDASNKPDVAKAMADGVRRLLSSPAETPIVDRTSKCARGVRAGDIAVIVATNLEAEQVAAALHTQGIRATLAREGLLATPEGALADSALRWLLDERDSLAAATLDALTGFEGQDVQAWLASRLRNPEAGAAPTAWRSALAEVRTASGVLAPTEALDRVLTALDAVVLCARWPDPAQRIANLDALRALAAAYEERCREEREAGTIAGLLRYFDAIREPVLRRDEIIGADHQHVAMDDDAVTVCTYHKSKGLEWPVVILGSLDRGERRDAFDVSPESDRAEFDPARPLEGRWIRYWPWPLGQTKRAPLADAAEASAVGKSVAKREEKERARLLYVGFTRARDHLILAVRVKTTRAGTSRQTAWLDVLADASGAPLVNVPIEAGDGATARVKLATAELPARVWHCSGADPEPAEAKAPPCWFARPASIESTRAPYRIVPSAGEVDFPELQAVALRAKLGVAERLGSPIRLDEEGIDHGALGVAVHAFLAADIEGLRAEHRAERAQRLLHGAGMTGIVRAESLVSASDAFRAWVEARWPGARWRREVPIDAVLSSPQGDRRVSGIIDLLIEADEGCVIIDHKTFPGTTEYAWRAKCAEFVPQIATYAELVRRVEGRRVVGCWVHLPVGGGMVEVGLG